MYLARVSFYGLNYGKEDRIYIIPCQNAEEAIGRLTNEIEYEYESNEFMIDSMQYLSNAEIL